MLSGNRHALFLLISLTLIHSACADEWREVLTVQNTTYPEIWTTTHAYLGYEIGTALPYVNASTVPDIVVGVLSAPKNFELRQACRDTWARTHERENRTILVWFVVGAPETPELIEEAQTHNDILFFNVQENYRFSLSPKVQLFFTVAHRSFPDTPWFMKTDDDSFLLFDNILSKLSALAAPEQTHYYAGGVQTFLKVHRNTDSPWFVSPEDFPDQSYPKYLYGPGYTLSRSLARCISARSQDPDTLYLPIEDAYTGILAHRYCSPKIIDMDAPHNFVLYTKKKVAQDLGKMVVHGVKEPDYFEALWNMNCPRMGHCDRLNMTVAFHELVVYQEELRLAEEQRLREEQAAREELYWITGVLSLQMLLTVAVIFHLFFLKKRTKHKM